MKPFCFVCAAFAAFVVCAASQAAAPPAACDEARVSELLRQLDDDDFFVRNNADKELRSMGKAVLPRLMAERVLTDSVEVRHRIDKMTASLTQAERLSGWVRLLNHSDARCRDKADQTLRQACPAALPALLKIKNTLDAQCKARLDKLIDELAEASF
jgi:hypothetical protein